MCAMTKQEEERSITITLNKQGAVSIAISGVITKRELLRVQKNLRISYREKLREYIKRTRKINAEKAMKIVQAENKKKEEMEKPGEKKVFDSKSFVPNRPGNAKVTNVIGKEKNDG